MHVTRSCSRSVTAVHVYCWYILEWSIPEVRRPADVAECMLYFEDLSQYTGWCSVHTDFWRSSFQHLSVLRGFMEEHRNCPSRCMHRHLPRYVQFYFEFVFQGHCLVPSVWQAAWLRSWCFLGMLQQNLTEKYFWSPSCLWLLNKRKTRCKILVRGTQVCLSLLRL